MRKESALFQGTDLPGALPIAIAAGLLALVLAPWLGSSADERCSPSAEPVASVADRPSLMQASTSAERSGDEECA